MKQETAKYLQLGELARVQLVPVPLRSVQEAFNVTITLLRLAYSKREQRN